MSFHLPQAIKQKGKGRQFFQFILHENLESKSNWRGEKENVAVKRENCAHTFKCSYRYINAAQKSRILACIPMQWRWVRFSRQSTKNRGPYCRLRPYCINCSSLYSDHTAQFARQDGMKIEVVLCKIIGHKFPVNLNVQQAQISRNNSACTVQPVKWIFGTEFKAVGWDKLVFSFAITAVIFHSWRNKSSLSETGFPILGFAWAILPKISESLKFLGVQLSFNFLPVKWCSYCVSKFKIFLVKVTAPI